MRILSLNRCIYTLLLSVLLAGAAGAQSAELSLRPGVAAHAGVDDVYRRFSEAYRTLNVDLVADQYTQTAAYLVPDDDVITGRENIRPGFKRFFDSVKTNGQSMSISFDIIQRKVDNTMGYDVGIFTLRTFKDGKEIGSGRGKFFVVAVKDRDGKWRFQVDGYNNLKPAAAS
jgi:ketosteroid isomerase-like protein